MRRRAHAIYVSKMRSTRERDGCTSHSHLPVALTMSVASASFSSADHPRMIYHCTSHYKRQITTDSRRNTQNKAKSSPFATKCSLQTRDQVVLVIVDLENVVLCLVNKTYRGLHQNGNSHFLFSYGNPVGVGMNIMQFGNANGRETFGRPLHSAVL